MGVRVWGVGTSAVWSSVGMRAQHQRGSRMAGGVRVVRQGECRWQHEVIEMDTGMIMTMMMTHPAVLRGRY